MAAEDGKTAVEAVPTLEALDFSWQQIMLRVKSPLETTLEFYATHFDAVLLDRYVFEEYGFELAFLAVLPPDVDRASLPTPGTREAHEYLWNFRGCTLELTHNFDSAEATLWSGNGENESPRGFGHIAFNVDDVYAFSEELEQAGVAFQKKPNEGRMKGLAFAKCPNGTWIEIVRRQIAEGIPRPFPKANLSQCMLRVTDIEKSLAFYCGVLGMEVVHRKTFDSFSLHFLQHRHADDADFGTGDLSDDIDGEDTYLRMKGLFHPILELTYNFPPEDGSEPETYHNGNAGDTKGIFGHIGFTTSSLANAERYFDHHQVPFQKRAADGAMRSLAFIRDPDNYWVEIIERGHEELYSRVLPAAQEASESKEG